MFNDRYYLVMVPAGCLLLAVAARPRGLVLHVGSIALLAALGWFALGGAYAYQRGLSTVIGIRNALLMNGVPRSALDAGYPLNGNDLYREAPPGERETHATEAGIPLITSLVLQQYTIAVEPLPDTVILKRFEWPGLWGIGQRPVYLLKRIVTTLQSVPSSLTARHRNAPGNRLPSRAVLLPRAIIVRLALMGLMMLAPTALVLGTFGLVPSPAFRRS